MLKCRDLVSVTVVMYVKKTKLRMKLLVNICLLILMSASAYAIPMEKLVIKGTLKKTYRAPAPAGVGNYEEMPFSVEEANTNYNISLNELGPNTPMLYYLVSDGMDIYQCFLSLKKSETEWLPVGSTLFGDIEEGVFPSRLTTAVQLLTFALTRENFQLASNNVLPLKVFEESNYYSPSNLWQKIELFPDGSVRQFRVFAPRLGVHKIDNTQFVYPIGYTNGYLVAEYVVKKYDAKNLLPLEFSFRMFNPKTDKSESSEDVDFWEEFDYSVDSIVTQGGNVSFAAMPETPLLSKVKVATINDYRLSLANEPSGFSLLNNDVIPFRSAKKFQQLALAHEMQVAKAKKGVVVFVLLLFSLVPVLAFLVFRKK